MLVWVVLEEQELMNKDVTMEGWGAPVEIRAAGSAAQAAKGWVSSGSGGADGP